MNVNELIKKGSLEFRPSLHIPPEKFDRKNVG